MQKHTVRMSFTVPKEFKAVLQTRAKVEGISMSELVRRAASEERLRMLSLPAIG